MRENKSTVGRSATNAANRVCLGMVEVSDTLNSPNGGGKTGYLVRGSWVLYDFSKREKVKSRSVDP